MRTETGKEPFGSKRRVVGLAHEKVRCADRSLARLPALIGAITPPLSVFVLDVQLGEKTERVGSVVVALFLPPDRSGVPAVAEHHFEKFSPCRRSAVTS